MYGTPRLRSSFPQTPRTERRPAALDNSYNKPSNPQILRNPVKSPDIEPLIPETWFEAPTQRRWAISLYVLLWTMMAYDGALKQEDEQSLWLFVKWTTIDAIFLFGLPSLRIPWLQFSSPTLLLAFCFHVAVNAMWLFDVPVFGLAMSAIVKSLWGVKELALSEYSVNPYAVRQNDTLILGRQIIHILPEGSAVLNPEKASYCLSGSHDEIKIPLTINATNPISMDLIRADLESGLNETIHFSKSQIKALHREASRRVTYSEHFNEPKTLYVPIKRPGLYALAKMVDETNLEVSKKGARFTVVVPCPSASIESFSQSKCRGELANIDIQAVGAAPLTVKYHKLVNKVLHESVLESVFPEDFMSKDQLALVDPMKAQTDWASPKKVQKSLNEHLGTAGIWAYTIDEVKDGFGNVVKYTNRDQDAQEKRSKSPKLHTIVTVHERPNVRLQPANIIKVASGKSAALPIILGSTGKSQISDTAHDIEYIFTPTDQLTPSGEHGSSPIKKTIAVSSSGQYSNQIKEPGLYTLSSVGTEYCSGEVLEPSSVLLENPPEPDVSITSKEIFDKCAGRPIGLQVDLEFVGTPPFEILWSKTRHGERHYKEEHRKFLSHSGQLILTPDEAGHYTYTFMEMKDAIYSQHSLRDRSLKLDQDVKPSAGASFINTYSATSCIDEDRELEIALRGEGPFKVEYELLHAGKRKKFTMTDITSDRHRFTTPMLTEGGEYTVALKTITDSVGCVEHLESETKIQVRHQKPKVSFGKIDGQSTVDLLEGNKVQLPLRLAGEGSWLVTWKDAKGRERTHNAAVANDRITVDTEGTYELIGVSDAICPGVVDEASKTFVVKTIPRPAMRIVDNKNMSKRGDLFVQPPVCEGEEDSLELMFKGAAPFSVQYHEIMKPTHGVKSPTTKNLKNLQDVASFRLDTVQAGMYDYRFEKLEDANYNHNSRHFIPISVQQQVYQRPSVAFTSPGKTYNFCSQDNIGTERIPITLHGQPPFQVELELRTGGVKSEMLTITDIQSTNSFLELYQQSLKLGQSSIALRRVSDGNGCSRIIDSSVPRIQISVSDPPNIIALESQQDFCVGSHISFSLSGKPPYTVHYTFAGRESKATISGSTFRRLAEKPGEFVITGVTDSASPCRANTRIVKHIHSLPWARVSKGKESYVDIQEGASTEILFEFGGVAPFEFTYVRSANIDKGKKLGAILEERSETSDDHSMSIRASEEGTYEITAIKDRYCSYRKQGYKVDSKPQQKRLGY